MFQESQISDLEGYLLYPLNNCFVLMWVQNLGSHSFSIGVSEVLNTNIMLESSADDDMEYVYQRLKLIPHDQFLLLFT